MLSATLKKTNDTISANPFIKLANMLTETNRRSNKKETKIEKQAGGVAWFENTKV